MKSIFSKRYRIVEDGYWYHCEFRYWFWPFWFECDIVNNHSTIVDAERYLNLYRNRLVRYYD